MKKIAIKICMLGYQQYSNVIKKLKKYKSDLFEIKELVELKQLPECDLDGWGYSDNRICKLLKDNSVTNENVDLCICFVNNPIEDNYFTRDLSCFDSKTVLCTFYEADTIFKQNNIDLFNYIHGIVLYETVQISTHNKIDENYFLHDDTRNCLFDMCGIKNDIAIKYGIPSLCPECLSKIESRIIDKDFVPLLKKEFKTFKKKLFYRIIDFIKEKPIISIIFTILGTIIINLFSSYIFELLSN